ncbi:MULTISPECIES: hypothetical protein [unclassified Pseudofrankia]|uniref:hypothetical protein n=1 Tax=unclassified Pseudofrankia TaxID=2994372 RepID=UPI0012FF98C7|nr:MULTISPECIES: hypothetical protein [unclassified Pseudofrankia]MDT3444066.1 hypothetical protein [Pseudofrankia sp. BMG5.37]
MSSCTNVGGNSLDWCNCVLAGLQQRYSAAAWAALSTREAQEAIVGIGLGSCSQYE